MADWIPSDIDDPAISGKLRLLRRIPALKVREGTPDSDNFRHALGQNTGWSCTLWESPADLTDVRRFHDDFGVVRLFAEDIRQFGLTIARRPLIGNLSHCEVFGDMSKKTICRALKKIAPWVIYPPLIETHMPDKLDVF